MRSLGHGYALMVAVAYLVGCAGSIDIIDMRGREVLPPGAEVVEAFRGTDVLQLKCCEHRSFLVRGDGDKAARAYGSVRFIDSSGAPSDRIAPVGYCLLGIQGRQRGIGIIEIDGRTAMVSVVSSSEPAAGKCKCPDSVPDMEFSCSPRGPESQISKKP